MREVYESAQHENRTHETTCLNSSASSQGNHAAAPAGFCDDKQNTPGASAVLSIRTRTRPSDADSTVTRCPAGGVVDAVTLPPGSVGEI